VKTLFAIVLTLGLLAASGFAQTCTGVTGVCISQVSNAASFAVAPVPGSSIAQGGFFAIFGTGFGGAVASCGTNLVNCAWPPKYPLPTTVSQTSVSVTVGSTTVAPLINIAVNFGAYAQINAVLPSNTPVGNGTLTVTSNGQSNPTPFPITVVANTFGAFAINEAGTGPAVVFDVKNNVITPFNTAKPGDVVVLWGSGLGPVPDATAEQNAPPTQTNLCGAGSNCPVTVWVGGQQAVIQYAGRSGYTAIDQIDFVVPTSTYVTGCYVQVSVQTGSVTGNTTSMAVDPTGPTCHDGDGIDYGTLASVVASKGQANVGAISMLSNYLTLTLGAPFNTTLKWDNDTVSGEIGTLTTAVLDRFQGFTLAPSVGNCTVSPFLKYPPPTDPELSIVTYLDAGASLTITGPNGSLQVPKNANGKGYSSLVGGETILNLINGCPASSTDNCAPFFLSTAFAITPGPYTVTSPGGADVGPLSAPISVSSAAAGFVWKNPPTGTIPRGTPLEIDWTGGDQNGFVDITAIASTLQTGLPQSYTPGILVECIANASDGKFIIPTYVLQSLPETDQSQATVPPGELLVGPASVIASPAPPTGLDALYLFYHYIQGLNVSWGQ